jgi:hypothetical protein
VAESAAELDFAGEEARALSGMWTASRPAEDKLSYLAGRIIILSEDSPDIG